MVTIAPRLAEVDDNFVIDGLGTLALVRLATNLVAWSTVNVTQPFVTVQLVSFAQARPPSGSDWMLRQ